MEADSDAADLSTWMSLPSRKPTYPTWGKGKSFRKYLVMGYVSSQEGGKWVISPTYKWDINWGETTH